MSQKSINLQEGFLGFLGFQAASFVEQKPNVFGGKKYPRSKQKIQPETTEQEWGMASSRFARIFPKTERPGEDFRLHSTPTHQARTYIWLQIPIPRPSFPSPNRTIPSPSPATHAPSMRYPCPNSFACGQWVSDWREIYLSVNRDSDGLVGS